MEQNSQNQNKNEGLFQKNQILIAVGVIIVLAIIIFFATKGKNQQTADNSGADQNSEQVAGENTSADQEMDQGQETDTNDQSEPAPTSADNAQTSDASGNVTAGGTLAASDDATRGNLMIQSDQGKIYIATKRDFSSLLGTAVTLQASGTINDFVFLGFAESPNSDKGGPRDQTPPATETDTVSFSGQLQTSDNTAAGNYQIVSGATKVYLQTAHDYSAWIGADVDLSATGTLQSFTGATLTKK